MIKEYAHWKRLLALILSAVLVLGIVPVNQVSATETAFRFADGTPSTVIYQTGLVLTLSATGGLGSGAVTYAIIGGDAATINETSGELTVQKPGEVKILATKAAEGANPEQTAEHTLTITPAPFAFETASPEAIQYEKDLKYTNQAIYGSGNGTVTYALVVVTEEGDTTAEETEITKIDTQTGELTILKAGEVTVQADKAADGDASAQTARYTLKIDLGEQNGFVFDGDAAIAYTTGLTYSKEASGGEGTGAVTYSISAGAEYADIDSGTGVLTIKKPGSVTVSATKTADEQYAAATAAYTLTITKGVQSGFAFQEAAPEAQIYAAGLTYTNTASGGEGTGAVTYAVTAGTDIASVDMNTGVLSITGYGEITVTATKAADDYYDAAAASYTLRVTKTPQTGFAFATADPPAMGYTADLSYTNTASGGEGTGVITYEVTDGSDIAQVDKNGMLTILKRGTVTVTATKAEDDVYAAAIASYTLTINGLEQETLAFNIKEPEVLAYPGRALTYTNAVSGGSGTGKISYAITEGAGIATINQTGTLTITGKGTIKITATKAGDDQYEDAVATYTLIVGEPQNPFKFDNEATSMVYAKDATYTQEPVGGSGEGAITYEITAGWDVAGINALTGELTIKKSGSVTVQAVKAADGTIAATKAAYTLTVEKAEQAGFGFAEEQVTVTYNQNGNAFSLAASGGESTGGVTYTIVSGGDAVMLDAQTNQLNILKAGEVVIKAVKVGDDCYEQAEATMTLTIQKAIQTVSFANAMVNALYGLKLYNSNPATVSTPGSEAAPVYAIVGENEIGATINSATGELTFGDSENQIGTITVQVSVDGNDCYEACSAEYTFTLAYAETPDSPYTLTGQQKKPDSGWYTSDVQITAPEGYEVSCHNTLSTSDWAQTVTCSTEGEKVELTIYLRSKSTGGITAAIPVVLKIDKTMPVALNIEYKTAVWKNILEGLLGFGFSKDTVEVIFTANDVTSQIGKMEYSIDGGATYTVLEETVSGYGVSIPAQYRNQVVLRVTDNAGNVITSLDDEDTENSGKTLVVDNVSPVITATLSGDYVYNEGEKIYYAKGDAFAITFNVTDANYDLREANPVIKVNDAVRELSWTSDADSGEAVLSLPDEGHYTVTADFTDSSENAAEQYTAVVYVDKTAPEVEIAYSGTLQEKVGADNQTASSVREDTRFVYSGEVTAALTVKETNFYPEDIAVQVNGEAQNVTWTRASTDTWKTAVVISEDGDYQITVGPYKDRSGNPMNWISTEDAAKTGTETYISNVFTVDTTAPEITVIYKNQDGVEVSGRYDDANRFATVTIVDRNFRPNEVALTVSDVNITGADMAYIAPDLMDAGMWTNVSGYTWQAVLPFEVDANYTVTLDYTDIAKYKAETYQAEFTVDKVNPESVNIEYNSYGEGEDRYPNAFEELIYRVLYYNAAAEVTLTATDVTSGMKGIQVAVEKNGSEGATSIKLPENLVIGSDGKISGDKGDIRDIQVQYADGIMTVTCKIPEQFRGALTAVAVDMAERTTAYRDSNIVVVDTILPERTVTFKPSRVVDIATMKDASSVQEGDAVVMYFNTDAVATFEITEANFNADEIRVQVNGESVSIDDWTNVGNDAWRGTLTIAVEGDYVIQAEYHDRANNEMVPYQSQRIVVDKTEPEIAVGYGNADIKNTIEGRNYFAKQQTATISIKEHNFRADDVLVKVSAKNAAGADVLKLNKDGSIVAAYEEEGKKRDAWTAYSNGTWRNDQDTYELTLVFADDANYTFDVEYADLATNQAADYKEDAFTVDKTSPTNLSISYSKSVLEEVLNSITFGFYQGQVTVNVTAMDETAGVHYFVYDYRNASGVSGVNTQLTGQRVEAASSGMTGTASFSVPRDAVQGNTQFNGSVSFTAVDRAENSAGLSDSKRIVVDNISPTVTVTYNPEVRTDNGIAYYNEKIECTIEVTEANFYADDVKVVVTKDGQAHPVNVNWTRNSADKNTGKFVLTEDGDYIVSIQYEDKSGNQMTKYESRQLTLDTAKPTIHVSNIKANSANKDKKYGFVIDIFDINLDADSIKPVLTAVVKGANGIYSVKGIDLGTPAVSEEGDRYTYTVEDLPEDALYTLTCTAQDMAENETVHIVLDAEEEYEQVQFSINRNGSTFAYGNRYTEMLVQQYYVYSVNEDVSIVEVNVDPIENYVITLNGKELREGLDYTTSQTSNPEEWSRRIYNIDKNLFAAEGEYNIIVSSIDKAETTAYSDVKNLMVAFVVDQTKPVVTITGLETGGRYQTDEQTVTLIPTDEGGRLNSLRVVAFDSNGDPLMNENGEDISIRFEMSGEAFLKYLEENDGKVTFTVPEGLNNQIRIVCNDLAVNAEGMTNEYNELFTHVTVSQNQWIIFYANKPLFYGCVAGALAILLLIIILLKRKKNKKEKQQ